MRSITEDLSRSKHLLKVDYLEKQGFEFYEIETSPSKPFGWERQDMRFSYNEILSHSIDSLKLLVEGNEVNNSPKKEVLKKEKKEMPKNLSSYAKAVANWAISNPGKKVSVAKVIEELDMKSCSSGGNSTIRINAISLVKQQGYRVEETERYWWVSSMPVGLTTYNIKDNPELAEKYGQTTKSKETKWPTHAPFSKNPNQKEPEPNNVSVKKAVTETEALDILKAAAIEAEEKIPEVIETVTDRQETIKVDEEAETPAILPQNRNLGHPDFVPKPFIEDNETNNVHILFKDYVINLSNCDSVALMLKGIVGMFPASTLILHLSIEKEA